MTSGCPWTKTFQGRLIKSGMTVGRLYDLIKLDGFIESLQIVNPDLEPCALNLEPLNPEH